MNWKRRITALIPSAVLVAVLLAGCGAWTSNALTAAAVDAPDGAMIAAAERAADIPTTQAFAGSAATADSIEKILSAGVDVPGAMNGQNWHFTAVTDANMLQRIAGGMGGGKFGAAPPANRPRLRRTKMPRRLSRHYNSTRPLSRRTSLMRRTFSGQMSMSAERPRDVL